MKLLLQRKPSGETATIGELFIDGRFECDTLEDVVREVVGQPVSVWKIAGKTAIPSGVYTVKLTYSPRFKRILPLIENVPGFSGVRIHPLNDASQTEGCIGPGIWEEGETVGFSKVTFDKLYNRLQQAQDITIEIRNSPV